MGAVGLLAAALVLPATAAGTDGNNGTVKIHEGSSETEPIVRNEPHVCTFHLHFFFADPAQAGQWEIRVWSPTDEEKGAVVLAGTYDTQGDGEDRQPAEGAYELEPGHYKLFWNGDLDSDKHDKHKVFWVECETTTTTTTGSVSSTTSATTSETTSVTTSATTSGGVSSTTSTQTQSTGTTSETTGTTSGGVSATTSVGPLPPTDTELPVTGNSTVISFGLLLLAVGSLVLALGGPLAGRKADQR